MNAEECNILMRDICKQLSFGDDNFFDYIENGKICRDRFNGNIYVWHTYFFESDTGYLDRIKMVVPFIEDELTLIINIHEYYHAYRLFNNLHKKLEFDVETEEKLAIDKEEEYKRIKKR